MSKYLFRIIFTVCDMILILLLIIAMLSGAARLSGVRNEQNLALPNINVVPPVGPVVQQNNTQHV